MTVKLYRDRYGQNDTLFQTAFFDFDGAQAGTDYTGLEVYAGTMATTGEDVSVLHFSIPLAGMDRLTGYDPSPSSAQNLCTQPTARVYQSGASWIIDTMPDAETVPVGSRPDDWDTAYMIRYYTRISVQVTGATCYSYRAVTSSAYSSSTQYYRADGHQHIYYTDGQSCFGVSRFFGTFNPISATVFAECCGDLSTLGQFPASPSTYSQQLLWKSGGTSGTAIVPVQQSGIYPHNSRRTYTTTAENTITGTMLQQLIRFTYGGADYIGIVSVIVSTDSIPQSAYVAAVTLPFWRSESARPNYGRASGIDYGSGTFSDPSQPVGIPGIPSGITATDFGAGMHIRTLSQSSADGLPKLMGELWGTGSFWSAWKNIRFDPLSCIVSLHVIPWQILPAATTSHLSIALTKLDVTNGIPLSRIIDISRGSVQIPEYYGSRLDYAPHTQSSIYLPFIGDYPLDISDVMGGALSLTYRVDIATGDCIAFLLGTDRRGITTISKSYKGNCAFKIPVSGSDNGGTGMLAALSAIAGGAVSLATGNVVGGIASALQGAWSAASTPIQTTAPQVQGSASAMGVLTPYVKIYRDVQARPEGYELLTGDTAAIGGTVAVVDTFSVSGFTVFDDVKLDIDATDAEKNEIMSLLRAGVFL